MESITNYNSPTERSNVVICHGMGDGKYHSKKKVLSDLPVNSTLISRFYHFCYVRDFFKGSPDEHRERLKRILESNRKRENVAKTAVVKDVNLKENFFMKSNLMISLENLCTEWENQYWVYFSNKQNMDFLQKGKVYEDMIEFERVKVGEFTERFNRIMKIIQSQSSDKNLLLNFEEIYSKYRKDLPPEDKISLCDNLNLIGRNITARSMTFRKSKTITPQVGRISGGGSEKIVVKT